MSHFLDARFGGKMNVDQARFYMAELVRDKPLPTLLLTLQQVFAVALLHDAKIIHRDIKLANVFIKSDGHVCIGDFGMAIPFSDPKTPVDVGNVCGTPTHLAPEVWIGQGYTTASDWWAVGVVMYELLHGQVSYDAFSGHY
jgi:serine/threonine protein kinase